MTLRCGEVLLTSHPVRKQEGVSACYPAPFLHLYTSSSRPGNGPVHKKMGLPISINIIKTTPHRHSQRPIPEIIIDPIQLQIKLATDGYHRVRLSQELVITSYCQIVLARRNRDRTLVVSWAVYWYSQILYIVANHHDIKFDRSSGSEPSARELQIWQVCLA